MEHKVINLKETGRHTCKDLVAKASKRINMFQWNWTKRRRHHEIELIICMWAYHIEQTKFQMNKLNISWEQNNYHQKPYAQWGRIIIMLSWLNFFLGHAFFSSTSQNKKGPVILFQVPRFKCVVWKGRHICKRERLFNQNKKRSYFNWTILHLMLTLSGWTNFVISCHSFQFMKKSYHTFQLMIEQLP